MNILNDSKYFDVFYRYGNERFEIIDEFPKYQISDWGRVFSSTTGIILKPIINKAGYALISLYNELNTIVPVPTLIYRLVAQEYVDGDQSLTVNHKDLDKNHNHKSNLEWISQSENSKHYFRQYVVKDNPVYLVDWMGNILNSWSHKSYIPNYRGSIDSKLSTGKRSWDCLHYVFKKEYTNEEYKKKIRDNYPIYIKQSTKRGVLISYYPTIEVAAKKLDMTNETIRVSINQNRPTKKFLFEKVDNPI